MTERWYFGEDPVSSVFAGDVRLYPTTPRQEPIEFPIIIDGAIYQGDDLHVFASNGKDVKWPSQATPIFVAVNGYESKDYDNPTVEPGDRIYALFDWDNSSQKPQDWYYDILQIGSIASNASDIRITQPRQLANGAYAFTEMSANPKVLANLDTSNLTNMEGMFKNSEFDVDISEWNTKNVTNMDNMFNGAVEFSQDIRFWCVSNIPAKPVGFSDGTINWSEEKEPLWGTCLSLPDVFPIEIDGKTYSYKDAHIFVANGESWSVVKLPIPADDPGNCPAVFVAVDGVEVTPTYEDKGWQKYWTFPANKDQIIHAIFDWDNTPDYYREQYWFSDILQFGLNSETGKRNQLKTGNNAFVSMIANPAAISNLDVSNVTDMSEMFDSATSFDQDISGWDVSNVTNMGSMFSNGMEEGQYIFNQDISGWNVSRVTNMEWMFYLAELFDQDLSKWCVSKIGLKPESFDADSGFEGQTDKQPQWGTCPRNEIIQLPDGVLPEEYELEDCHIFVANGNQVYLPIPADDPNNCPAVFVAVDGVEVTPTYTSPFPKAWTVPANENQTIHAIFDWNNKNFTSQDWYSDILQFGLNSVTKQRNQLKDGEYAFYEMEANPAAISNIDTSNLTVMSSMFSDASSFNQDISGWDTSSAELMPFMFESATSFNSDISQWDTSKVQRMDEMFSYAISFNSDIGGWNVYDVQNFNSMFMGATSFDQDLSEWCVIRWSGKPTNFDTGSGFAGQTAKQPQWGTCPRNEIIQLPDGVLPEEYELADCHIFIANGNPVVLAQEWDFSVPEFVAVDGEEKDYSTEVKGLVLNGSTIHAIFDWNNNDSAQQNWYSDILQFGSRSVYGTGQPPPISEPPGYVNPPALSSGRIPNQLKSGMNAFMGMEANPETISRLDASNLTYMNVMFSGASNFNQDLSNWNVSNATQMSTMFKNATSFNQDLSKWCVSKIGSKPHLFDDGADAWEENKKPVWGTCPLFEDTILDIIPDGYELEDCHIFIANSNYVKLALGFGDAPIFVAVDGVEMDYETDVYDWDFPGSTIHAIFDWNNLSSGMQNWYSDLVQFGSRSVGDEPEGYVNPTPLASGRIPNQMKGGKGAFKNLIANSNAISNLDTSNLTDMGNMFDAAPVSDLDISQWDTSNVTNMSYMFTGASNFNSDISKWNTSRVKNMKYLFRKANAFDSDLSGWNTSSVTDMGYVFREASSFNSDISGWDTSRVTDMRYMFYKATVFNQDLSEWCVSRISSKPSSFDSSADAWEGGDTTQPQWGECPRNENTKDYTWPVIIDRKVYEKEDAHIFVANGNPINFPIPSGEEPLFVGVNGKTQSPITITRTVEVEEIGADGVTTTSKEIQVASIEEIAEGDVIEAIFDWDNLDETHQNWYSDILQIGLNSETGERNQLKNGNSAFLKMRANPAVISNLDTSNLTSMYYMFIDAFFNQDISKWDTSKVEDMDYMFNNATSFNSDISEWNTSEVKSMHGLFLFADSFNQDLSEWCVGYIESTPNNFDTGSAFAGQTAKQPSWGTCPRLETIPDGYSVEDCHIFVANANEITLPVEYEVTPVYIAVDGAKKDYNTQVKGKAFNGSTIHAIFDWYNWSYAPQDWFSDILQFGLNSVTGKRNQLKSGFYAFYQMACNPAIISTLDISYAKNFDGAFSRAYTFNQDISGWDTSHVKTMKIMFGFAYKFNQDIGGWDTSKVTNMETMFRDTVDFNQDLSQWCVSQFDEMPEYFNYNSGLQAANQPKWGTCPRGENLPDLLEPLGYGLEDCHIFVSRNTSDAAFAIPENRLPKFVAVNGVDVTPTSDADKVACEEGDIVYAIFDWDNENQIRQNWFSDILQFGLNSETGKRNQLKNGNNAFYWMTANPAAIVNLDISNLTDLSLMFASNDTSSSTFNQDISGWDTSKVTNMDSMFAVAGSFNQDLSQWCVSQFNEMPSLFDFFADAWTKPKPVWGTCPRNENVKNYTWPITIGNKTYEKKDAHIFVSNGNEIKFPIPEGTKPTFVGVNGETRDPIVVTRTVEVEEIGADGVRTTSTEDVQIASITEIEKGDIIEAIFDWNNANRLYQSWFSDILQFGLNSETGKRNQLKDGYRAFTYMVADPAAIVSLDVSNLASISGMFYQTPNFNKDLSGWNTSKVTDMEMTFMVAPAFDQDLSQWCVTQIDEMPTNFDNVSGFQGQTAKQPQWGTCPRGEDIQLPDGVLPEEYELADCHVFIGNGKMVNLPIANGTLPKFVAVDGVDVTPTTLTTRTVEREKIGEDGVTTTTSEEVQVAAVPAKANQTIHAIFDWDNENSAQQDWFSDILQFGLNSETKQRNQLKGGYAAFYMMEANPAAISKLDVYNIQYMDSMFEAASNFDRDLSQWHPLKVIRMFAMFSRAYSFNQDISQWDTSNVENMSWMFKDATSFNQDISEWCVIQFTEKPPNFDFNSGFEGQTERQPQWETCPRGEGIKDYTWPITLEGKTYDKKDAHIFISNGKPVNFPIQANSRPIFVGVNGQTHHPIVVTRTVEVEEIGEDGVATTSSQEIEVATIEEIEDGDIIEAIFDWTGDGWLGIDCYKDILQIGSRSLGGEPSGYVNPPALPSGRIPNQLKKGSNAFYRMVANPVAVANLDVSNLTRMDGMFYRSSFNQDISKWDVSNVTDMGGMFRQTPFNQDISGWDVSQVWRMRYTFTDTPFNKDISQWNTSKVEDMCGMFNSTPFNQDISAWNTSKVTDMESMFNRAYSFNQDLSQWCVSAITNHVWFDYNASAWTLPRPVWGTCPRGEDKA